MCVCVCVCVCVCIYAERVLGGGDPCGRGRDAHKKEGEKTEKEKPLRCRGGHSGQLWSLSLSLCLSLSLVLSLHLCIHVSFGLFIYS